MREPEVQVSEVKRRADRKGWEWRLGPSHPASMLFSRSPPDLPAYGGDGTHKNTNTQGSKSPTTLPVANNLSSLVQIPATSEGNERQKGSFLLLTLKGSELLSSPEEEKRRGRVFDAEVQTENPENNQRGSGVIEGSQALPPTPYKSCDHTAGSAPVGLAPLTIFVF